jgi:hypothetical protein
MRYNTFLMKEDRRLILRLHEHKGEGVTLYKTPSYPMELYDKSADRVVVAIEPLSQQTLNIGLLKLAILKEEEGINEFTEQDKGYAAFPESFTEDIKTALSIIDQLASNTKLSLTTHQRTAVNQMISGIFWGMHSEIVSPEILV